VAKMPRQSDIDIIYALCSSIVAYMRELQAEPGVVQHFYEFLRAIPKEFAVFTLKDCHAFAKDNGGKNVWTALRAHKQSKIYAKEMVYYIPFTHDTIPLVVAPQPASPLFSEPLLFSVSDKIPNTDL
jgi:hypothetical protein